MKLAELLNVARSAAAIALSNLGYKTTRVGSYPNAWIKFKYRSLYDLNLLRPVAKAIELFTQFTLCVINKDS
jgi:hypothetical protein